MKPYISSPLAALALLFLLLSSFHSATAARPLTATPLVHRDNDAKAAADGLIHQEISSHCNEELSVMTGVEEEACEEGNEECLQRRLLSDAHLDYIYTQHHHKP